MPRACKYDLLLLRPCKYDLLLLRPCKYALVMVLQFDLVANKSIVHYPDLFILRSDKHDFTQVMSTLPLAISKNQF